MSHSDILLNVSAVDQSSEVIVIDNSFRVLARGICSVELKVSPGIYNAKLRVGDQFSEKLFIVKSNEPNGQKSINLKPLEFASPIPLQHTSTYNEHHEAAIYKAAKNFTAPSSLGKGAVVLICLRDISSMYLDLKTEDLATYAKNFQGFTLSSLDGNKSYPLETIGTFVPEHGFLIVSASVNPGNYVLSQLTSDNQRLCLPLVIPKEWSLQVFVSMVPYRDESMVLRADFDGAAMMFAKPGSFFDSNDTKLRISEVARQALAKGHDVIDVGIRRDLLSKKFSNPMIGLLAAHLLLLAKEPDLTLIKKVVADTANLIGIDYPDLLILRWKLQQIRGKADSPATQALIGSLNSPPMFQLSWHYFMEAYRYVGDMGTINEGVAEIVCQLISASVWLSWLTSDDKKSNKVATNTDETDSVILDRFLKTFPTTSSINTMTAGFGYLGNPKIYNYRGQTNVNNLSVERLNLFKELLSLFQHAKKGNPDEISQIFSKLIELVDWNSVVADLKSTTLSGSLSLELTPLESKILLSLKAAREQFDVEQKLPDTIWLHQYSADVPMRSIWNSLISLIQILPNSESNNILSMLKLISQNISLFHQKATVKSKPPEITSNQNSAKSDQESPESVTLWDSLIVKKDEIWEHVKKDEIWEHVENDKKSRKQNHEEGEIAEE